MPKLERTVREFVLAKRAAGRSPDTIAKYEFTLHALSGYTDSKRLEAITANDIRRYLANCQEAGLKPASVDTYYRTLATFFRWCAEEYQINNPMERVEKPGVPKTLPPFLSDEAVEKILAATVNSRCRLRDQAIVVVLFDTGIRPGELVGLKISDVDLEAREMRVFGKDQEERIVPLGVLAVEVLASYLAGRNGSDAPLFPSRQSGEALTVSGLRQMLGRLARRSMVQGRVYTHLLRHTFSHRWLTGGGDLESLRKILGHNRLDTTQIYARLRVDDMKRKHRRLSPADRLLRVKQLTLW